MTYLPTAFLKLVRYKQWPETLVGRQSAAPHQARKCCKFADGLKSALAVVADRSDRPSRPWLWVVSLLIFGTVGCTTDNSLQVRPGSTGTPSTSQSANEESGADSTAAPSLATVAPDPDDLCADVEPGDPQQPIALTNLRFHRPASMPFEFARMDEADEPIEHLIGCITNQTESAIAGVHLQMSENYASGEGFASAHIEFPGQSIAPGQTVPFKSPTEFNPVKYGGITELTILEVTTLEPKPGYEDSSFDIVETFQTAIKVAYAPAQAPAGESVADFCTDVEPSASVADAPIAVDKLQIYDLPRDAYDFRDPLSTLIGCVTNLTDEPLPGLSLSYGSDKNDFAGATLRTPVDEIQPGQTVPFRKYGDLAPGTNTLYIHNLGDLALNRTVTRQGSADND